MGGPESRALADPSSDELHAVQGFAVQGFAAPTDQDETTGGLLVVLHQDWVSAPHPGSRRNFRMVTEPHRISTGISSLPNQLVACQARDLVLCAAGQCCNMPALTTPTMPLGELLRARSCGCDGQ